MNVNIVKLHPRLYEDPQIYLAFIFAKDAHKGQTRKFTNEPYVNHCIRVANTVYGACHSAGKHHKDACIAALLHDTIEDTRWNYEDIDAIFGDRIAQLVWWLTEVKEPGVNRAERKKARNTKFETIKDFDLKTIKLANNLDNLPSMIHYDPNFGKVYKAETLEMLPCLSDGSEKLWSQLSDIAKGRVIKDVEEPEDVY